MDEKDLAMLLAMEQTKSITHAAELLFINQSSLSKRLQALENKLGKKLFIRSNTGVSFTPEGRLVLEYAEKMQRLTTELNTRLATNSAVISGTLNLGCSIEYAHFLLPKVLANFQKKFPAIQLRITTDYSRIIHQKLLADQMDIAIIRGDFPTAIPALEIARENVYLVSLTKKTLAELKTMPFINRNSDRNFKNEMEQWMIENDLYQLNKQTILVDNVTSCVAFVQEGLGWAIVPAIALGDFHGYAKQLFFKDGQPFTRSTHLMYKESRLQLPAVAAFKSMYDTQR